MVEQKQQNWRKGPARHLLRLVEEDFQLVDCYISGDNKCRVLIPDPVGKVIDAIPGPPSYEHVLQTYEAMQEHLRQLGSFVNVGEIPRREFERLILRYNILVKLSNNKRKYELRAAA